MATTETLRHVDPPRRRLSGDDRRRAILDSARSVFARKGFHGAGTAEIAAVAGCSEPMLYKHFPSKLALFAAVLNDAASGMRRLCDQLEGLTADPTERFAMMSHHFLEDPEFTEKVRLRALAMALVDEPEVREVLIATAARFRCSVAAAIEESQRRGTVRRDVDPEHVAWLWSGLTLTSGFRHAVEGQEGLRQMTHVTQTLYHLLRVPVDAGEDTP